MVKKRFFFMILFCLLLLIPKTEAMAFVENPEEAIIVIEAESGYFNEAQIDKMIDAMTPLLEYGNVVFLCDENCLGRNLEYLGWYYRSTFGDEDGIGILIDYIRDDLYVYTSGSIDGKITVNQSKRIEKREQDHMLRGDYCEAGIDAFLMVDTLLKSGSQARVTRAISDVLGAIALAMLIHFVFILITCTNNNEVMEIRNTETKRQISLNCFQKTYVRTTKKFK